MQVQPRRDAVSRLAVVAAPIVEVARMQRHVNVAREVNHEGERFQPDIVGQTLVGKNAQVARDLRADAIAARAVLARVIGFGHRLGLVMPGRGIAPAPALAPDAVGPGRGIDEVAQRAVGCADLPLRREQPVQLGARFGPDVGERDFGGDAMGVEAPGRKRCGHHQRAQRQQRDQARPQAVGTLSYCSITHCSSSAAAIHCWSQSWVQTACM